MKILTGLAVAIMLLAANALADVVVPVDKVENHVNVRMTADSKSEVVGRLEQGRSMPHLGTENGWRKVALVGGGEGFISADWTIVVAQAAVVDEADTVEPGPAADTDTTIPPPAAEPDVSAAIATGVDDVVDNASETSEREAVDDETLAEAGQAAREAADLHKPAADATIASTSDEAADIAPEPAKTTAAPEISNAPDVDDALQSAADSGAVDEGTVETARGPAGPPGPPGPQGPPGPPGSGSGGSAIEGNENYVVKFTKSTIGGNSQIFDDGRNIGIGTEQPKQRLEVNGSIQIHEQNSSVAGLMITQSSGETGYIMHNRASTLTIGAGSVDRVTIDRAGNVGFGQSRPTHPLELASGAHVTAGGVWTNSSSIANKENVKSLTPEEALAALADLEPVLFNYKTDRGDRHVGFIAEDVPELVASRDRTGLSSMDVVAVLTKVVQLQQQQIEALERRLSE